MNKYKSTLIDLWNSIKKFNFFDLQHSWLKLFLFITLITISTMGLISYIMTQKLLDQLRSSARTIAQGYASVLSIIVTEAIKYPGSDELFQQGKKTIAKIPIPVILTDLEGMPQAWRNVGVDQDIFTSDQLDTMSAEFAMTTPLAEVIEKAEQMDEIHNPIPIFIDLGDEIVIVAYLHHGNPPLFRTINLLPLIQTFLLLTLLITLLFLIRITRSWEKDNIWMLMAKETAHQLATPLSSMMGWIELMRTDEDSIPDGVESMDKDLVRMNGIIQRFSRIGTPTSLIMTDLNKVARDALKYFSTRLPSLGKNVDLILSPDEKCFIKGDYDLLTWVVENMIKNSLDAMDKKQGRIEVKTINDQKNKKILLQVIDNGKGINRNIQSKVFQTGYSSKKFGWGMGLTLAKRIVERIHFGEIFIEKSKPGEGTTITIAFAPFN